MNTKKNIIRCLSHKTSKQNLIQKAKYIKEHMNSSTQKLMK